MPTISGHLDQFPFDEFLQTLASLRRTGRLSLSRQGEWGQVMLRDGRVVGAASSSVDVGSEEATRDDLQRIQRIVSELTSWQQGEFEFEPEEPGLDEGEPETDSPQVLIPEGVSVERVLQFSGIGRELEPIGAPTSREAEVAVPELQPRDFETLLESDPEPILVLDAASRIVYANPALCKITGKSKETLLGEEIAGSVHPDDVAPLREVVLEASRGGMPGGSTVRFREADVAWRKCYLLPSAFGSHAENRYVLLRALTAGAAYARFDPLTGLLDYDTLTERVGRILERARRENGEPFAVLFLGINQFTRINERYGWAAGNEVLRLVGDRLARNLRPGDVMARATGDKFCVALERLREAADAELVARRIASVLAEPIVVSDGEVSLSVSIGVATSDEGHERAGDMLGAAWTSMLDTKSGAERVPEEKTQLTKRRGIRRLVLPVAAALGGLAVLAVLLWPRSAPVESGLAEPLVADSPADSESEPSPPRRPASELTAPVEAEVPAREVVEVPAGPEALPATDAESPAARESVAEPPVEEQAQGAAPSLPEQPPLPDTVAPLELELRATEEVWVQVSIDGAVVLDAILRPGQSRSFEGQRSAELVVGNAGGLAVVWNGSDLGSLGASGRVRRLHFTPTEVGPGKPPQR